MIKSNTQTQKNLEWKYFQQKLAKEENNRLQDCISKYVVLVNGIISEIGK